MKRIRYIIEAVLVFAAFGIFWSMPAQTASNVGGWIGRTIGPHLGASRKARTNLENAYPEKSSEQIQAIIIDMWDNLGRVFAEYPHLDVIINKYTEIKGEENVAALGDNDPAIFIGAHMGNWEIIPYYFSHRSPIPAACIYREPNNPYVAKLLEYCRNPKKAGIMIPKSLPGARTIVKTLQDGGRIAVLIDQKYNQGIAVPFMGRPAMTSASFAQLGEKYNCPIFPLHLERVKGCHLRMTIHRPFYTEGRGEEAILIQAHGYLEEWINRRPGHWLWLHRRWNSKALENFHN